MKYRKRSGKTRREAGAAGREAVQTRTIFRDGQKETNKPVKSFGDTGIPVRTMTRGGKKYQSPRRDRLQMAEYTPDSETRGRLRTDGVVFIEGRLYRGNMGDPYQDTGKRRTY